MKRTFILLAILLPLALQAQMLHTYTATVEQSDWNSISTTGTQLTSVVGDYGYQTVSLPFDFAYGLSDFAAGSSVCVRCDGFVKLLGSCNTGSHDALGYWGSNGTAIICPFMLFDGQMPSGTSGCWWQVMDDDNGEQMLVIEWNQVQHYPAYPISSTEASQDNFNYQLRLHSNGDISCLYGHMYNGVSSDTLFNFFLTDGTHSWQYEAFSGYITNLYDQVALRGTWDSIIPHTNNPGYRSGNNWVVHPYLNLAGCPDSGTLITWHRPLPPCPHPTQIAVSEVTHNSALLSWTPNEVIGSLVRIQYDTMSFTPGSAGHNNMLYGGDTCHLSLLPNHNYWLSIRSDCGTDSSEWLTVTFSTPCTPLSLDELPLSEDFEDYTVDDPTLWDGCWKRVNGPEVKDVSSWDGRPNMAIRIANIGWMHLPPVDSLRITKLRFRAHGNTYGSSYITTLHVGVMSDPFDINTFDTLQTFSINHNSWEEYTVPLAIYNGNGNTVAFKWSCVGQAFIDDIELSVFDGCLAVDNVTVDNVGKHDATVHWSAYVPTANYRVVWHPAGNALAADSITLTSDSLVLGGLTPNTDYVVMVYSLCNDTTISEAVSTVFHTRCAVPLPLDQDFDSVTELPDCWEATSMKTYYTTGSYTPPVPFVANSDVQFSSSYINEYKYERGILLLPFVDTAVNRLRMTFDYRAERLPNVLSMIVGVIPDDDNLDAFLPVATIYPFDTLWHTYTVETGVSPYSEGRLVMMQHSISDHVYVPGYNKDLGHVDNIHIEVLPGCVRPAAAWATHVTSTSALIHWMEINDPGTYIVSCNGTDYTVVGDTLLLIDGLDPDNGYTASIRRLCDDSYTSSRTVSFMTACSPVNDLPWSEDFENWTDGVIDHCWLSLTDGLNGSEVNSFDITFIAPTSYGSRILRMKSINYSFDPKPYDAYVVLPEFDFPLNNLAIGFNAIGLSNIPNTLLELGLMDDASDSSSFRPLDTVTVGNNWSYYEHAFLASDSGRLALHLHSFDGETRVGIDNLSIFPATNCPRPQALTVDTVTQHSVTVSIADSLAIGHYRLYFQSETGIDSTDVDTTTATVTGLASSHYYVIHATALCDNGLHISNTVSANCFTDCDTISHADLPYQESFDGNSLNHCWSVLPAGENYVQVNNHQLRLTHFPSSGMKMAIMPAVDTLSGIDLTFYARTSFASDGGVIVGVLSDPTDMSSFSPIDTLDMDTIMTGYQLAMTAYAPLGHHIAFMPLSYDSTWSAQFFLDDITLSQSLPCERPDSVTVENIEATTATLTIHDAHNNRHYRVTLTSQLSTTTLWVDFDSTDYVYSVDISGLTPSTEYTVSVASVCYDSSITFSVASHFISGCAPMPLPWHEGFENGIVGQLPRCWTMEQGSGHVYSGTGALLGSKAFIAYSGDSAAWMDISTSELAFGDDSIHIRFYLTAQQGYNDSNYHYHALNSRLQLFAALADSLILINDDTVAFNYNWQLKELDVAALPHGARLLFRFWRDPLCTSTRILSLDELTVRSLVVIPQCDSVAQVSVSDIGYTYATVSWTPAGDEQRWELNLQGDGIADVQVVDTTSFTYTILSNGTTYSFVVRPMCNDTLVGLWSETYYFTTTTCEKITEVNVDNIGTTTATLTWQAAEGQSHWQVSYGPYGFVQGDGTTLEVDENSTVTLEGLSANTTYDVYIRSVCDEGVISLWSPRTRFTTASNQGVELCERTWTVAPNPTDGIVILTGIPEGATVSLLDMQGRCLEKKTCYHSPMTLDLSKHPAGAYFLRVERAGITTVSKLVKK